MTTNIKNAIKILEAARDKLSVEGGWTQGVYAKDENDDYVEWYSDKACKFCSVGATRSSTADSTYSGSYASACLYLEQAMDEHIAYWNDEPDTKQEHVLMAFDFAILMAQDELAEVEKFEKVYLTPLNK